MMQGVPYTEDQKLELLVLVRDLLDGGEHSVSSAIRTLVLEEISVQKLKLNGADIESWVETMRRRYQEWAKDYRRQYDPAAAFKKDLDAAGIGYEDVMVGDQDDRNPLDSYQPRKVGRPRKRA